MGLDEEEQKIGDIIFRVAGNEDSVSYDFLHKFMRIYTLLRESNLEFRRLPRASLKLPESSKQDTVFGEVVWSPEGSKEAQGVHVNSLSSAWNNNRQKASTASPFYEIPSNTHGKRA